MSLGTVLIIVLLFLLLGGGFTTVNGGPFFGTGPYGGSVIGIIFLVVLIMFLTGRLT